MDLYKDILSKYGLEAMRLKWIEELNELSLVLIQWQNKKVINTDELVDEVADVKNILSQIIYLMNIEEDVDFRLAVKLSELPNKLDL